MDDVLALAATGLALALGALYLLVQWHRKRTQRTVGGVSTDFAHRAPAAAITTTTAPEAGAGTTPWPQARPPHHTWPQPEPEPAERCVVSARVAADAGRPAREPVVRPIRSVRTSLKFPPR